MSDEPVIDIPATVTDATAGMPVLPLRDVVVYPHMVIPLFVGREKSIVALDLAMKADKRILLVAQKQADVDDPKGEDLYRVGTVATILQLLKLPDGTVKVLVEGVERASIDKLAEGEFFSAEVTAMPDLERYEEREMDVLTRSMITQFEQYVKLNKKVPPEILTSLAGIEQAGRLADTVAAHMSLKLSEKQKVLEIPDVRKRLEHMLAVIEGEMDVLQIEKRIRGRVKQQMEKSQREYYLNEQMKAIQKELGELDEAPNEIGELEKRIKAAGMPKEAREKANSELAKLKLMSPMSAEATVVRNFIDWLVKAPWKKRSKVHLDIAAAEKVLEADHFGLEKVKERIVEYLAVQQRVKNLRGPILCLVGPPGVGKTSLGQSVARSTNRKFVRMSLGGVRDEAEIRGHRRTYIGSMPGKIIQNLAKCGVRNPLFLLDEVDKMSTDFRGDPVLGAARGARSRAEQHLQRPLPGGRFRPFRSDVRVHGEQPEHSGAAARPHGGHPHPGLHRGREEQHRAPLPAAEADQAERAEARRAGGGGRRHPGHDPLLHPRGRRAQPRARDLEDRAQGGQAAAAAPRREDRHGRLQEPGRLSRRAPLPLRQGRGEQPRRPGHGPRVDRGRRRAADHRGGGGRRQGQAHAYRAARRSDAGIHPGGHDRGAQPLGHARARDGFLPEGRRAHSRARRARRRRTARARASACARR